MRDEAETKTGDRLLYGCMGLGGAWDTTPYGPGDIDAAEAAVQAALDIGITTFDHADIYRHGKSEAVFGEVLSRTPVCGSALSSRPSAASVSPTATGPVSTTCGRRASSGGSRRA